MGIEGLQISKINAFPQKLLTRNVLEIHKIFAALIIRLLLHHQSNILRKTICLFRLFKFLTLFRIVLERFLESQQISSCPNIGNVLNSRTFDVRIIIILIMIDDTILIMINFNQSKSRIYRKQQQ